MKISGPGVRPDRAPTIRPGNRLLLWNGRGGNLCQREMVVQGSEERAGDPLDAMAG